MRKILISYLKQQRLGLLIGGILLVIITFILTMYNVPSAALLYCLSLVGVTWGLYLLYKGYRFYQKCTLLSQLENEVGISLDRLNTPEDLIEEKYQMLLKSLYDEKYEILSQIDAKQSELNDYYTLWAHQIKTPIAAMRLLLQTAEAPKELNHELLKIEQYVEMVLQYLRLESMSSDLVFQEYPLDDIVKQAVKKNATLFIQKKLTLNLEELNCNILTDEKWLLFVIEQLLFNAIKYTAKGSISIYMENTKEKTLVIEDTGIGIRKEDLPQIFERGFTGYNGRMDKKSTGIGLFLCYQILSKLSHQITITSEVGKGTKIYLDLSRDKLSIK